MRWKLEYGEMKGCIIGLINGDVRYNRWREIETTGRTARRAGNLKREQ